MKNSLIILFQVIALSSLLAQTGLNVELIASTSTDTQLKCVNLAVSAAGASEPVRLSSQNYRMYYNSANIKLVESSLDLNLPKDGYQMKLVQHVLGVDATGTGDLPFEGNLGFINLSVVQNNLQVPGVLLSPDHQTIVQMCFEVKDSSQPMQIVLARSEATSQYGRAYIELSSVDMKSELKSTKIVSYKDYLTQ